MIFTLVKTNRPRVSSSLMKPYERLPLESTTRLPAFSAFAGVHHLASGTKAQVARAMNEAQALARACNDPILAFDNATGAQLDLDLRGTADETETRYAGEPAPIRKRGRPRLGVVGKEVTLLPRHWEWLSRQRGGASAALRRLIDQARQDSASADEAVAAQGAAHAFASAIAGNEKGFEEAMRALYRKDPGGVERHIASWPDDVRRHFMTLAAPTFGVIAENI